MTSIRRDANEAGFSKWIRAHPRLEATAAGLSVMDSDFWIHRFLTDFRDRCGTRDIQHLMLLEVKSFGAEPPPAQLDTLQVIYACLCGDELPRQFWMPASWRAAGRGELVQPASSRGTDRRLIKCWGVHVLRMQGACPATSTWLQWDQKVLISATMLEELLRFERHPITLRKRTDRRHHVRHRTRSLFDP